MLKEKICRGIFVQIFTIDEKYKFIPIISGVYYHCYIVFIAIITECNRSILLLFAVKVGNSQVIKKCGIILPTYK